MQEFFCLYKNHKYEGTKNLQYYLQFGNRLYYLQDSIEFIINTANLKKKILRRKKN